VITAYAVTAHPGPPLPDQPPGLRLVPLDGLAAACAPVAEGQDRTSADALWRHEAIVEALMADRDLVPLRYGTRFDDESAAAAALEEHRSELLTALDRVRGALEVSLRIAATGESTPTSTPATGREYLRERARVAELRDDAARRIDQPLASRSRASTSRPASRLPELLRCAYLVDRSRLDEFQRAAAELDDATTRFSLLCTGPWPPYSFVGS
jgi:hypothetical protein